MGLCSAWCMIARLIVFYMVFVGVGVSFVSFIVVSFGVAGQ